MTDKTFVRIDLTRQEYDDLMDAIMHTESDLGHIKDYPDRLYALQMKLDRARNRG